MKLKRIRIVILMAMFLYSASSAHADTPGPVVVELFTSQSCYSCPPAEAFLAGLADDPSLVTLEWHVDYWDDLVYGGAGKWKDPYSSNQWTQRQRTYNRLIRGKTAVYTPQAVIQGRVETVGSKKDNMRSLIAQAALHNNIGEISFQSTPDALAVFVKNVPAEAVVSAVYFIDTQSTRVPRGENKGKTLASRHVVKSLKNLGKVTENAAEIDRPATGQGCAILVQEARQKSIITAAYCPKG